MEKKLQPLAVEQIGQDRESQSRFMNCPGQRAVSFPFPIFLV